MKLTNNKYNIGGVDIQELASQYGTPLYIYDSEKIAAQFERFCKAFSGSQVKLKYACKALSNISVLSFIRNLGIGIDTVSPQEILLALEAGYQPSEIIFTPNCVGMDEIIEAVNRGVNVNIDSLFILEEFGKKYGSTVPVGIRIKPHVLGGGNLNISTGHIDSKFGISFEKIENIKEIVSRYNIQIDGLHMHTGSDILDMEVFLQATDIIFSTAKHFPNLNYLDFGSGFKVPYKSDDYQTDIELLGEKLSRRFNTFCKEYGRDLTLFFEPGKFLVSESGYFLTKVNVVKPVKNTTFACINSGMNHLIRPMYYKSYHQITNISKPTAPKKEYSVVGYICETDTFAWNREINEIEEGDYLIFHNAGAYCFSMASNYNSRLLPAEVLIHNGKPYLIRKRQSFEDLIVNQIKVNF